MFRIDGHPVQLGSGVSRRECLRAGGLSALGLSLPQWLAAQAQANAGSHGPQFGRAKRCIMLFLLGGPPQHETWDPKPDAPAEVRGPFNPIDSRTPGMPVCELMPLTAQCTDKIAVLRAMSTYDSAHSSSGYWMLTGYPHTPRNTENAPLGAPNDWPSITAMAQRLLPAKGPFPTTLRLPDEIWNTGRIPWPGQDAGFMGRQHDPWLLKCEPEKPGFKIEDLAMPDDMPSLRFEARRSLLAQINERLDRLEQSRIPERWDGLTQQAFDLLRSGQGRAAFDLELEAAATRERYGQNRYGQSILLARRLIEAGVSLVQVNWGRWDSDKADNPAWDTHRDNAGRLKNDLMPQMDQAYSALIEDLAQRGLLDDTLVIWMGEFGRTPKINGVGGRDHWGPVFCTALAGGGVRGGIVHGSSDKLGAHPADGRVEPWDLSATIFHLLGIPPHTEFLDRLGRPMFLSKGTPIKAIL